MIPHILSRRWSRLLACSCLLLITPARGMAQDAPAAANQPAPVSKEKTKKVYTNDDVASPAQPTAETPKPAGGRSTGTRTGSGDPRLAQTLKTRLEKLAGQLKDTDQQLIELKKFAAGETDGSASRNPHKGVNRLTVAEQIQNLERKKSQLKEQIEGIYDEARKKGIPPGALR